MLRWAAVLVVGLLTFGASYWAAGMLDTPPKTRKFIFTLADESTFIGYGTEVRNSGFCTELVVGEKVTAAVCGQHVVSEVYEVPQAEKPHVPKERVIV